MKRRLAAGGAIVVIGVGTGVGVAMAEGPGAGGFRTARAAAGDAVRTLTVSGTVQPVDQAKASFQVAGTVSSVAVSVGQQVTAGETLATLDTTSLSQQVSLDQTNLATAQAKLAQDESGQTSSGQTTSSAVVPNGAVLTAAVTTPGGLTQAQQAVVDAQHAADQDMQTSGAALGSAQSACSATTVSPGGTGGTGGTSGSTPTTQPQQPDTSACTTALEQAYAAEQQVYKDQQAVQNAEKALAQAITALAASTNGTTGSSGNRSSSNVGSAATDSAAQLATDQAAIDNDEASLVSAQHSLDSATLTAPMNGTVAAMDMSPGQAVSANSSSFYMTIIDAGSFETVSSLATSQVSQVATGDPARVTVDGQSGTIAGTISTIGPVSASSSGYTYPMIVSLDAGPATSDLVGGSAAQIQIETGRANGVLVVPTSAVHTTAPGRSYVMVVDGGREVQTTVRTGVVGELYTQITSGIHAGAVVALADPSQAVPSSSANSTTGLGGRAAFFGAGRGVVQRVTGGGGGGGRLGGGS